METVLSFLNTVARGMLKLTGPLLNYNQIQDPFFVPHVKYWLPLFLNQVHVWGQLKREVRSSASSTASHESRTRTSSVEIQGRKQLSGAK